jgi:hypothetical protein
MIDTFQPPAPVKPDPIFIGVDVGQINDSTAISVAEASSVWTGKMRHATNFQKPRVTTKGDWIMDHAQEKVMQTEYTIRSMRRLPLGTSYPAVADYLADLLCNPLFSTRKVRLLIDVTGVGRPIYDMLRKEISYRKEAQKVAIDPISFVHGEQYNRTTGRMGKAYMVSRLQTLLQSGRVHAPRTEEVLATLEELKVYEVKVSQDGKDTYGASTGKHDDLATALALSVLIDPFADRARQSAKRVY